MTSGELAQWAQVGKNSIKQMTQRFGIRELTGNGHNHRYSVYEIFLKIIGAPLTAPDEQEILLKPLQKTAWLSKTIGLGVSAINTAICEERLTFPNPIELTRSQPGRAAPRGRRWVPAQIEAYLRDDPIPFIKPPIALKKPVKSQVSDPPCNVFSAICTDNAEASRQCHL